jgi:prepilin-type processing-associated H-X9-DG protein
MDTTHDLVNMRNLDGTDFLEWDGKKRLGMYAMNNYVFGYPDLYGLPKNGLMAVDKIISPTTTYFMADARARWMQWYAELDQRHFGTVNMLWLDGHVTAMKNIPQYQWAARPWFNFKAIATTGLGS